MSTNNEFGTFEYNMIINNFERGFLETLETNIVFYIFKFVLNLVLGGLVITAPPPVDF